MTTHRQFCFRERPPTGLPSAEGFSLLEVVGVVGIVAVLTAAAAPTLSATTRAFQLRGAARQVFSALQKARIAGVEENNRYSFTCTGERQYSLCDDDDSDGVCEAGERTFPETLDAGVRFVAGAGGPCGAVSSVQFYADGTASGAMTIPLTTAGGGASSLSVSPAGRIRIQ